MEIRRINKLLFKGLETRYKLTVIEETDSYIKFKILDTTYLFSLNLMNHTVKRIEDDFKTEFNIKFIRDEYKRLSKAFVETRPIFGFFNTGKYQGWRVEDVINIDRDYILFCIKASDKFKERLQTVILAEKVVAKGKTSEEYAEYLFKRLETILSAKQLLKESETFEEDFKKRDTSIFQFGKYKGQLLSDIELTDLQYVTWYKKQL